MVLTFRSTSKRNTLTLFVKSSDSRRRIGNAEALLINQLRGSARPLLPPALAAKTQMRTFARQPRCQILPFVHVQVQRHNRRDLCAARRELD